MFCTRYLGLASRVGSLWRQASTIPAKSAVRSFHFSNKSFAQGSLFGDVTQQQESEPPAPSNTEQVDQTSGSPEKPLPQDDAKLQEYYMEEAKADQLSVDKFVSPLKKKLFDLNVAQNGFFKNGQLIKDPESSKSYKLTLTPQEIDILEPTVYIKSYRIKSSMKKATVVNRFVRGYYVKNAINQLHFNPKKMSTELEKLLKRGLSQARDIGMNEDGVFIQALWVGSDGDWRKRLDAKGRGRTGIIKHPYVHLKAILKGDQSKNRMEWERQQKLEAQKPKQLLNNEPLNFRVKSFYRW